MKIEIRRAEPGDRKALASLTRVHRDNRAARRLCDRAGLEPAAPRVYRDRYD